MIKTLLDKEKREDLKEKVEVAFALFTIASYVSSRIKKRREAEEAAAGIQS